MQTPLPVVWGGDGLQALAFRAVRATSRFQLLCSQLWLEQRCAMAWLETGALSDLVISPPDSASSVPACPGSAPVGRSEAASAGRQAARGEGRQAGRSRGALGRSSRCLPCCRSLCSAVCRYLCRTGALPVSRTCCGRPCAARSSRSFSCSENDGLKKKRSHLGKFPATVTKPVSTEGRLITQLINPADVTLNACFFVLLLHVVLVRQTSWAPFGCQRRLLDAAASTLVCLVPRYVSEACV